MCIRDSYKPILRVLDQRKARIAKGLEDARQAADPQLKTAYERIVTLWSPNVKRVTTDSTD